MTSPLRRAGDDQSPDSADDSNPCPAPGDSNSFSATIGGLTPPARHALRLDPLTGANESILATGFWYLGEWVHSPVDIRADEAERFANMIDVYSKAFLGLTVACARCHDHKFDPITTKDYYALQGYLQSSHYRQVRYGLLTTGMNDNGESAGNCQDDHQDDPDQSAESIAEAIEPVVDSLDEYLIAARDLIQSGVATYSTKEDVVFEDFKSGTYRGWTTEGTAFGTKPKSMHNDVGNAKTYFASSLDSKESGHGNEAIGVLTSEPFVIDRSFIRLRVRGGDYKWRTCVLLMVDDQLPHAATGQNDGEFREVIWDVRAHRGKTARIRLVDNEKGPWGHISVDQIVFTDTAGDGQPEFTVESFQTDCRKRIDVVAEELRLDHRTLGNWTAHLLAAQHDESDPFYLWAAYSTGKLKELEDVHREAKRLSVRQDGHLDFDDILFSSQEMRPEPCDQWADTDRYDPFSLESTVSREPPFLIDHWWEFKDWSRVPDVTEDTESEPGATQPFVPGVRLRTPTFEIETGKLHALIYGGVNSIVVVDSHILVQGPLHNILVKQHPDPAHVDWRWIEWDVSRYIGHRAHIEFAPRPDELFAIADIIESDEVPTFIPAKSLPAPSTLRLAYTDFTTDRGFARRLQEVFDPSKVSGGGYSGSPEGLQLSLEFGYPLKWHQRWATGHPQLFDTRKRFGGWRLSEALQKSRRDSGNDLGRRRPVSALAPAMVDGSGEDEYVFIRGNWKKRGETVPRRFLEVFGGDEMPRPNVGSGRLELAEWMVDPAKTPILPRVIVNRIWLHYFGQGIVATPDDFGYMGQDPSHPELLDWLASELVEHGWSLKHIHRLILTSAAYQMASGAAPSWSVVRVR